MIFNLFRKNPKQIYRIRLSTPAATAYDHLNELEDERLLRVRKTLSLLETGQTRKKELTTRLWREPGAYGAVVYESFISQSEPDFLIIWHYYHDNEIVILRIEIF